MHEVFICSGEPKGGHMKYFIVLALSFSTLSSAFALSYECKSVDGQKLLIYQEGADQAVAVLEKNTYTHQLFKGTYVYADEYLYDVTNYELNASNGSPAQIVLTKQMIMGRGSCGRGGCHTSRTYGTKKAKLTLAGVTTDFDC